MTGNEVTSLYHNHPLYLQPGDAPGLILIQLKLTGPYNYALWSRAMKLALRCKGKLGFVDGTCVKSMYKGELAEQWEKCNTIVLSWIESTVAEELMASIVYASNSKKEENQILLGVVDVNNESLTMLAGRTYQGFKPKKPRVGMICEHCGSKRKLEVIRAQDHFFTNQQYKQILDMLNKPTSSDNADNITGNMAGMTSLLSNNFTSECIIDTGASHHITPYKELLTTFRTLRDQNNSRVQVPIGGRAEITSIRDTVILGSYKLENVLHVPDFKFNLLSVSKITKQLCCVALFFPDFCVFQGLFNGKVLEIGKEKEGLYILQEIIKPAIGACIRMMIVGSYGIEDLGILLLEQCNILQM
uniref:Retrotransposon Copia-like N-terminal domain-containing protein n=1 Tax=Nicotiana tabacum TaxID=4097 RepID=A0A1S4DLF2_TOBAC|nr:PREDICTED: uncharacterized protein LOC107831027 [Nicotiana tabacum]